MGELLGRNHDFISITDQTLLAFGAYTRLIGQWAPVALDVPSVLLRASDPVRLAADPTPLPPWPLTDEVIEVPGSHFSVLEQDVESTAEALEEWLSGGSRAAG